MKAILLSLVLLFAFAAQAEEATPTPTPTATPTVSPFAGCKVMRPNDGRSKGFLWKPVAAHFSTGVALLPGGFVNNVKEVVFYTKAAKRIGRLYMKSSGDCAKAVECVFRPQFLPMIYMKTTTSAQLKKLYGSVVARAIDKKNKCYTWVIKDPMVRQD